MRYFFLFVSLFFGGAAMAQEVVPKGEIANGEIALNEVTVTASRVWRTESQSSNRSVSPKMDVYFLPTSIPSQ